MDIVYSNKAKKFLKSAEKSITKIILDKLEEIRDYPLIYGRKKLGGKELFRVRVGNYRILYEIKQNIILAAKIDKRGRVYKD